MNNWLIVPGGGVGQTSYGNPVMIEQLMKQQQSQQAIQMSRRLLPLPSVRNHLQIFRTACRTSPIGSRPRELLHSAFPHKEDLRKVKENYM